MICAYSEIYIEDAQKNIGDMLDYAVNTLEMDIEFFWKMFANSRIAKECERGNPMYIAGKNGCEIADAVLQSVGLENEKEHVLYLEKSPEYWCGWVLAYYQWYKSVTYERIQKAVSINDIRCMYNTMHEADITRFITTMNDKMGEYYKDTRLKFYRTNAGYSQSELAKEADVPLRQIQMVEQRKRDINKMNFESVLKLSRVLKIQPQDLYETDFSNADIC